MQKHEGKDSDICPVARIAALLGDECTLLIIRDLIPGPKRFKDFVSSLSPISSRTIANKLKLLEEHKLITRSEFKEKPPRVEYTLTNDGKKLTKLIDEMRSCGKKLF